MEKWPSRSVVVGTDLSDGADEAIRQADAWARRAGLPLMVVHAALDPIQILPLISYGGVPAVDWATVRQRTLEALRSRVESITHRGPDDVQLVVEAGSGHGVTIDVAVCAHASLVVVGTTTKGALGRLVLGSTAEQIVRHAPCSVLVARRSPSSGVIVAATDLSDRAMVPLCAAADEARRRSGSVVALHCIETAHPALSAFDPAVVIDSTTLAGMRAACSEVLHAQLERAETDGMALVAEGRAASAIVHAARAENAELVVVGTHGRTGLARVALGSVAEAVARNAHCSVLVARSSSP